MSACTLIPVGCREMEVSHAPWPLKNMTRGNPKHVSDGEEGRGAELRRVLASRVAEQQIFLTVKRLRDSRNNSFISLNIYFDSERHTKNRYTNKIN